MYGVTLPWTPPEIVNRLRNVAAKVAKDPAFKVVLARKNLRFAQADAQEFCSWPRRARSIRS